ncbi:hypothetical protein GWO43_27295 [candidate division KSB1 bacterium]|nr:hypothetical protein [candidate division KSB1 bacterium]NIR70489.1 hypothetical protein [candidate division KSB1 bacterium]NIS27664.1 hypothetical protein [candidate division KSB1 bacterium]NIT74499.1 hypothetical protein [candidate division KSB1 bacterium]NIU23738.1 hypothetical protein [candidate division KSB1 bacterium]
MKNELKFLDEFPKDKTGNYIVYELFTFDNLFRLLLKHDFDHQEAMDFLIATCSFSAPIFQEKIFNKEYENLKAQDALSPEEASVKAKLISDLLQII